MIRREINGGWVLFTQFDHSVLSGEIMKYWGNHTFRGVKTDPQQMYAITYHDKGWIEWDSNPRINPENNYPASFIDMYPEEQHVIWSRCFEDIPEEYLYSSALIALHFSTFNNHLLSSNPGDSQLIEFKNKIINHVSEILNIEPGELESGLPEKVLTGLKYIQIGDVISLTFCNGWDSVTVNDVPVDNTGNRTDIRIESKDGLNYKIEPYPFSDSNLEFDIKGLQIKGKEFSSDKELRTAIKNGIEINFKFTVN